MVRAPVLRVEPGAPRIARRVPEWSRSVVGIGLVLAAACAVWELGVEAAGATMALAFAGKIERPQGPSSRTWLPGD